LPKNDFVFVDPGVFVLEVVFYYFVDGVNVLFLIPEEFDHALVRHFEVIDQEPKYSCRVLHVFDETQIVRKGQVALDDFQLVPSWRREKHLDAVFVHELEEFLVDVRLHDLLAEIELHDILEVVCHLVDQGGEVGDLVHVLGHSVRCLEVGLDLGDGAVDQSFAEDVETEAHELVLAHGCVVELLTDFVFFRESFGLDEVVDVAQGLLVIEKEETLVVFALCLLFL
jgi:hypothetical protein